MWYNDYMDENTEDLDDLIPVSGDVIEAYNPMRRRIAEAIGQRAENMLFANSIGKDISYVDYLALMLWDAVTEGVIILANGNKIEISDTNEWMSIVRFMARHLDGPTTRETPLGVNIFKVYMGIDESKI